MVLEDHIQVVVVLDVLDTVREYTFISVDLINKKGFDTMRFRDTGKSPRRNLKTKWVGGPICLRFSWRRSDWWAPEARFF